MLFLTCRTTLSCNIFYPTILTKKQALKDIANLSGPVIIVNSFLHYAVKISVHISSLHLRYICRQEDL